MPPRALALAKEYRITHVIAHHEADVALAAQLRERLGLDGAWSADITPFRDKVLMKQLAQQAGIEVARTPRRAPPSRPATSPDCKDSPSC